MCYCSSFVSYQLLHVCWNFRLLLLHVKDSILGAYWMNVIFFVSLVRGSVTFFFYLDILIGKRHQTFCLHHATTVNAAIPISCEEQHSPEGDDGDLL